MQSNTQDNQVEKDYYLGYTDTRTLHSTQNQFTQENNKFLSLQKQHAPWSVYLIYGS